MNNINQTLPKVIATTVVRTSQMGEAHGYIYLIDLENETFETVYELTEANIDWKGRGGDRGFRGIAQLDGKIYIPIGASLFVFNRQFELLDTFTNPYLTDIHELVVWRDKLYLLSTYYDSVMAFDPKTEKFTEGLCIKRKSGQRGVLSRFQILFIYNAPDFLYYPLYKRVYNDLPISDLIIEPFDPESDQGPEPTDTMHFNSISVYNDQLYISGSHTPRLYVYDGENLSLGPRIPHKTHNAQIKDDRLFYNHTIRNKLVIEDKLSFVSRPVHLYSEAELINNPKDDKLAAHGFARGMAFWKDHVIIGSSPATVSLYSLKTKKLVKHMNMSMDTRNAIHGLAVFHPQ